MCRYGDMSYFNTLPLSTGVKLISTAIEEREKDRAWDMWLVNFRYMDKKTFIPFSDYWKKLIIPNKKVSTRSTEEILATAYEIRKQLGKLDGR